jgi:DNA-binding MarR family transcriptional regulator
MSASQSQRLLKEIQDMDTTKGVDMNEMLFISDELRQLLVWMIRTNGFQAQELQDKLAIDYSDAVQMLDAMRAKGLLEEIRTTQRFQVNIATTRSGRKYQVPKDVWKVFD